VGGVKRFHQWVGGEVGYRGEMIVVANHELLVDVEFFLAGPESRPDFQLRPIWSGF